MTFLSQESFEHFARARRWALVEQGWRWLSRRPRALLSFGEVRALLGLGQMIDRGYQEIELARVIGTVAKQEEFTRGFRPRKEINRDRWRRVDDLLATQGFDPIDAYKVGGVYFVVDGHHRISVARANGIRSIEAHITEWASSITLGRDDSLEHIRARMCGDDRSRGRRLPVSFHMSCCHHGPAVE